MSLVELPPDVMLHTLTYLDFESLISIVCTCKKLYMQYSDRDTLWRSLISRSHQVSIGTNVPVEIGTSFRAIFQRIQRQYEALTNKPKHVPESSNSDGFLLFKSLIVRGLVEHSLVDGKRLASMQLRIERGPWNAKTFKLNFDVQTMMNPQATQGMDERRLRSVTNSTVKLWRDLPKVPERRAYLEYLHFALSLEAAGAQRFTVKQLPSGPQQIKLPGLGRNQILCVTRFSVVFLSLNSHQVISVHPLSSLHTWVIVAEASSFGLKFLVESSVREYLLQVEDPREIDLAVRRAIHRFNHDLSKSLAASGSSRPVSEEIPRGAPHDEPEDGPAVNPLAPDFGPWVMALRESFPFHSATMEQLTLGDAAPLLDGYQRLCCSLLPNTWRVLRARLSGYSTFSVVSVAAPTLAALREALLAKVPLGKSIRMLLWLPDTIVADDQDVLCLPPLAQIQVELEEERT